MKITKNVTLSNARPLTFRPFADAADTLRAVQHAQAERQRVKQIRRTTRTKN